ncbi:hypothetical protein SAMN05446037_104923 [Anaerovirgula multivorans]|uniref:Phage protein n=1 Tax=Anaerovirgula multivorans TaxID=312168 RepID=A0A239KK46_9FIRM|nr:hypothetical protein [Anaerovirgula multivorans]SNT18747.1 hypothetical protein SAMN05446037_104923 [Anaerovirgula multivorans]
MKLVDIQNAIYNKIKNHFPTYDIYTGEMPQEFTKPAFFIHILPIATTIESQYHRKRRVNVEIRYFSQHETHLENLEMVDQFNEIIDSVFIVEDRKLMIDETKTNIENNILSLTFDVEFTDSIEETKAYNYQDYDYMEELLIKEE